jgi:hypothetical protein
LRQTQIRKLTRAALVFAPLAALAPAACAQGNDRILYFVDEQGVLHMSNVPVDPRYKPPSAGSVRASPTGVAPEGTLNGAPVAEESIDIPGSADVDATADGPGESEPVEPPDGGGPGRRLWGR